jgi:hypothetical protein
VEVQVLQLELMFGSTGGSGAGGSNFGPFGTGLAGNTPPVSPPQGNAGGNGTTPLGNGRRRWRWSYSSRTVHIASTRFSEMEEQDQQIDITGSSSDYAGGGGGGAYGPPASRIISRRTRRSWRWRSRRHQIQVVMEELQEQLTLEVGVVEDPVELEDQLDQVDQEDQECSYNKISLQEVAELIFSKSRNYTLTTLQRQHGDVNCNIYSFWKFDNKLH